MITVPGYARIKGNAEAARETSRVVLAGGLRHFRGRDAGTLENFLNESTTALIRSKEREIEAIDGTLSEDRTGLRATRAILLLLPMGNLEKTPDRWLECMWTCLRATMLCVLR